MKRRLFLQLFQWLTALACGYLIVNGLCFFYERPTGWLDTYNGPSMAVRNPGSMLVRGSEGYGIHKIDENGYMNPSRELNDSYILMLGSSHTEGKEVAPDQKYSLLVSDYLADGDDKLYTYNIACEGHFLPTEIRHFAAAAEAYPGAEAITIELPDTDYSIEELRAGLDQAVYDPDDNAEYFSHMSFLEKAKVVIKEASPLLTRINSQIVTARAADADETSDMDIEQYLQEYESVINEALALMRSEYDGPIIILYHPKVVIEDEDTLSLQYSGTWDIFRDACIKNNIDVIDTGQDFIELYQTEHELPYGFSNTLPGDGHLNANGHRIMADAVIRYLEEHQ